MWPNRQHFGTFIENRRRWERRWRQNSDRKYK